MIELKPIVYAFKECFQNLDSCDMVPLTDVCCVAKYWQDHEDDGVSEWRGDSLFRWLRMLVVLSISREGVARMVGGAARMRTLFTATRWKISVFRKMFAGSKNVTR